MAESATSICNQALARIGAKRINDYGDTSDTKVEAIYCRLFYEPVCRALMREHLWRFAKTRAQLSQDTTSPAFQWDYSYALPTNFLRLIAVYDGSDLKDGRTYYSYELEGSKLLIDESTVYLKYVQWVSDVPSWDALFVEAATLRLAEKLVIPLTQDGKMKADIGLDLYGGKGRFGQGRTGIMAKIRAMDRNEMYHMGREELKTWKEARYNDIP